MTINRLVKKAQRGSEKAFLKLFQQYEEDIYRIAYVYVKNKHDALDVVQEVAYQSFKKIDTLRNPEYFKTWLMRITMNCAINVIRNNKRVIPLHPGFDMLTGGGDENLILSLSLQELIDCLHYSFQPGFLLTKHFLLMTSMVHLKICKNILRLPQWKDICF